MPKSGEYTPINVAYYWKCKLKVRILKLNSQSKGLPIVNLTNYNGNLSRN